jgi:hypothetical protein
LNTIKRPLAVFCLTWLVAAVPAKTTAAPQAARGDVNNDGSITLADAIYLSRYLFARGPAPVPSPDSGDANCDGRVEPLDAVVIVNYVVRGGKRPACPAN